ncbi:NADP-dependent oxidoreductase [Runella sp.]|uniref:NADP-dependent oxidoreductase n=1 Tax=Runella sp. TaxID=1960881 RepID=UPI003D151971
MKAIILKDFGGVEQLVQEEIPVPTLHDNEVLVKVKAFSINPVDIKTRNGKGAAARIKDQTPMILGWDISGVITEMGANVSDFKAGDEVFGMVNFPGHGKAYAEYVAVPASQLALKPENISHEEAAAATLAALTAWLAVVHSAKVQAGQKVLIHAASGGVGHFAVQIAHYLGAYVIGTSSAANRDFVLSLGADQHIDYKAQSLEKEVSEIDFVLDALGGETIDQSLKVIKPGGTIISMPSGANDLVTQKAEAKGVHGYPIMVHSSGKDMKDIADLLEKGILKAHVSKIVTFDQIAQAHHQVESGKTVGKVVVTV